MEASPLQLCPYCLPTVPGDHAGMIRSIVPTTYENFIVCGTKTLNQPDHVEIMMRLPSLTEDEAQAWIKEFGDKSKCPMKASKRVCGHLFIKFRRDYVCHLSRPPRSKFKEEKMQEQMTEKQREKVKGKKKYTKLSFLDTNCHARIYIVKQLPGAAYSRKPRVKDPHLAYYPTFVRITWCHNHPLESPDVVRYCPISDDTRQKMRNLFEEGYCASAVMSFLQHEQRVINRDNLREALLDHRVVPLTRDLHLMRYKILAEKFGHRSDATDLVQFMSRLETLSSRGGFKIKVGHIGGEIAIALSLPFVERVHSVMPQSGEFVFVDATKEREGNGYIIRLLTVPSAVGGLPLGCLLSTSDSVACTELALRLLLQLLPETTAFYGRGAVGPMAFLTTGWSWNEHEALSKVFPQARVALSPQHLLRSLWEKLWSKYPGAKKEDRPALLNLHKEMLHCYDMTDLEHKFELAKAKNKLTEYFNQLWQNRTSWAVPLTGLNPPKDHALFTFFEAAFCSFRTLLTKSRKYWKQGFQLDDLAVHMGMVLTYHYERHIQRILQLYEQGDRVSEVGGEGQGSKDEVLQVDDDMYHVKLAEEESVVLVDLSLGKCECRSSSISIICSHILVARHHIHHQGNQVAPLADPVMRQLYGQLVVTPPAGPQESVSLGSESHPNQPIQPASDTSGSTQSSQNLVRPSGKNTKSGSASTSLDSPTVGPDDQSEPSTLPPPPADHSYQRDQRRLLDSTLVLFDLLQKNMADMVKKEPEELLEPFSAFVTGACNSLRSTAAFSHFLTIASAPPPLPRVDTVARKMANLNRPGRLINYTSSLPTKRKARTYEDPTESPWLDTDVVPTGQSGLSRAERLERRRLAAAGTPWGLSDRVAAAACSSSSTADSSTPSTPGVPNIASSKLKSLIKACNISSSSSVGSQETDGGGAAPQPKKVIRVFLRTNTQDSAKSEQTTNQLVTVDVSNTSSATNIVDIGQAVSNTKDDLSSPRSAEMAVSLDTATVVAPPVTDVTLTPTIYGDTSTIPETSSTAAALTKPVKVHVATVLQISSSNSSKANVQNRPGEGDTSPMLVTGNNSQDEPTMGNSPQDEPTLGNNPQDEPRAAKMRKTE